MVVLLWIREALRPASPPFSPAWRTRAGRFLAVPNSTTYPTATELFLVGQTGIIGGHDDAALRLDRNCFGRGCSRGSRSTLKQQGLW